MRAVLQRVSQAKVTVKKKIVGQIGPGFLVLLGVGHDDTETKAKLLAKKIAGLRIFNDDDGKMNLDLAETSGAMLVVSQFTLWADCRKGRRPSFTRAGDPERAEELYEFFCHEIARKGIEVATGQFQTEMKVDLTNDGPVTLILDTEELCKPR
jgi:D-aminoacyl-tRNA deacylase